MRDSLRVLQRDIVNCELCERLITYCRNVAQVKRRAYRDQEYWGKPVPGFGDPKALKVHLILTTPPPAMDVRSFGH